jgi:hypothetical protein
MTSDPEAGRRSNGQWEKRTSGNKNGRPVKERRIPSPESARDMVYELGLFEVPITINGDSYDVPLIIANYLTIGSKGARGDLRAAQTFTTAWNKTVDAEASHIADLERRFQGAQPGYLQEPDPVKRQRMKAAWDELMTELAGKRPRTSEPFPPRKRRRRRKAGGAV